MHLLNIYVIKNFISKFAFLIIGFMSLFLIVDIIDHINKFIDSDIPRFEIINYYLYSLPWFISIALPMTTLLACIFTIGQLQKNHELCVNDFVRKLKFNGSQVHGIWKVISS